MHYFIQTEAIFKKYILEQRNLPECFCWTWLSLKAQLSLCMWQMSKFGQINIMPDDAQTPDIVKVCFQYFCLRINESNCSQCKKDLIHGMYSPIGRDCSTVLANRRRRYMYRVFFFHTCTWQETRNRKWALNMYMKFTSFCLTSWISMNLIKVKKWHIWNYIIFLTKSNSIH